MLNDTIQAEGYFEMVVQRTPEYMDASDFNYESPTSEYNKNFGRRFEILSYRWVEKNEI
jgi:hypothetical protein